MSEVKQTRDTSIPWISTKVSNRLLKHLKLDEYQDNYASEDIFKDFILCYSVYITSLK